MARKRMMAEHIIIKLREAEVGLAQGQTVGRVQTDWGRRTLSIMPALLDHLRRVSPKLVEC